MKRKIKTESFEVNIVWTLFQNNQNIDRDGVWPSTERYRWKFTYILQQPSVAYYGFIGDVVNSLISQIQRVVRYWWNPM